MTNLENGRFLGNLGGERLRRRELVKREQIGWRDVLGVDVDVKPLPEYVTPEIQQRFERMGLGLYYIPALDLGSPEDLERLGVERYLTELQKLYPKWKRFESLREKEVRAHGISRNLNKWYWESVNEGDIDFPELKGQWMAIENVEKPRYNREYRLTPLAEQLGFKESRITVSWKLVEDSIDRNERKILSNMGISNQPVDIGLLDAHEWNLMANRKGWGRSNTYEWTNTEYRSLVYSTRLMVGNSERGGASSVRFDNPAYPEHMAGFRIAVILGSAQQEQK